MAIIYLATNRLNKKSYVGFTKTTLKERFERHCEKGYAFHDAITEYGLDCFDIVVLEESSDWLYLVSEREPHYIDKLGTLAPNGYNLTKGGEYPNLAGKEVDVYDNQLKLIDTVESIRECGRKYQLNSSMIHKCCQQASQGKASRLGKYHFCYSGDSVRKKTWNTAPGLRAAKERNTGRKRPEQADVMKKVNESRRDLSVHTFIHKNGNRFVGTRYDLKDYDPQVSIGELGVLVKGGYKSHKGWTIGK